MVHMFIIWGSFYSKIYLSINKSVLIFTFVHIITLPSPVPQKRLYEQEDVYHIYDITQKKLPPPYDFMRQIAFMVKHFCPTHIHTLNLVHLETYYRLIFNILIISFFHDFDAFIFADMTTEQQINQGESWEMKFEKSGQKESTAEEIETLNNKELRNLKP